MGQTGWGGVTLTVELDLSQSTDVSPDNSTTGGPGLFLLEPGVWNVTEWDLSEWMAGPVFTDITEWVLGLDVNSGFSYEMSTYQTGRLALTLDNSDGRFSPDNPSSPYRLLGFTTIGMLRPIRVTATYNNVTWPLFAGRLESWTEEYQGAAGAVVQVTALDYFSDLADVELFPTSAVGAGDTFGARVNRILDAADWTGARSVDVGSATMQATDLGGSLLDQLRSAAEAEGGSVYASPNGTIHAEGRNALLEKDRSNKVQVTFSNVDGNDTAVAYETSSLTYEYDGSQVVNSSVFAVEGGVEQRHVNQESINLYGLRATSTTGLIAVNDSDALVLAKREVALFQSPERRVESLRFFPMLQPSPARIDEAWRALSTQRLQLRSLAKFEHDTNAGFTIDRYLYVRSLAHRITPSSWTVEVGFSSATVWQSLFASRWDVGVWGSSAWSW